MNNYRTPSKIIIHIKKFKSFMIPVLCLMVVDQITKVIIASLFVEHNFDIIGHFLRFNPKVNTNLSWVGNYVDFFSNFFIAIVLNFAGLFIFVSGYLLYKSKRAKTSFLVKIIMICGIAGCLCSLIDKLFWGGSLDYLQIPFFIFDLKDCYLTVAQVLFVIIGVLHNKEISVKEYVYFCCSGFSKE